MRKPRTVDDFSIFCTEFALRKAPGMFRSGRGCPGGVFRGGVRPRRVLRDVPGTPLGRKCQYPGGFLRVFARFEGRLRGDPGRPLGRKCQYSGGFLRVFARREGPMCENHVLSTILPLGGGEATGPGRAWVCVCGKTDILLQNVCFVEAKRDFAKMRFPGALFISFYPMSILLSKLRNGS